MQDRPKLGEILVAAGVIDGMQLESALGEQARWGRRLGVTLIKLGMVDEQDLIRGLAKQLEMPVASLAGKRIPEDVVALVPSRMASDHGVMPLFVKHEGGKGQLYLGMEDPSNIEVLDDLSFRTGMEVFPVMVGPTELGEALDRYYLQRAGGAPSDPFHSGETLGEGSLRAVSDDGEEVRIPEPEAPALAPLAPLAPLDPLAPLVPPVAEPSAQLGHTLPLVEAPEIELNEPAAPLPDGLVEDIARAVDETEKTRFVAKAMVQLLIEKGVFGLDEVQAKIAEMKGASES